MHRRENAESATSFARKQPEQLGELQDQIPAGYLIWRTLIIYVSFQLPQMLALWKNCCKRRLAQCRPNRFPSICKHSRAFASVKSKTPFEVLSLPETASSAAIKKRYYELAKTLHPDRATGDLDQFREVVRAYELLSDPNKRSLYLRTGLGWDTPSFGNGGDPWKPPPGNRPASYTNAYWATADADDDIRYKGGPWSSHENTRFMKNGTFITIVAGVALTVGILHFVNLLSSHANFKSAIDRHHIRTSQDLERARTEAQLFGNQRAVERMMERRMRYFRDDAKNNSSVDTPVAK